MCTYTLKLQYMTVILLVILAGGCTSLALNYTCTVENMLFNIILTVTFGLSNFFFFFFFSVLVMSLTAFG